MAMPTATRAPPQVTAGCPGQGQGEQRGPGHAEGAQGGEFRRIQDELAADERAQYRQREQAGQRGKHGQGDRRRADGLLRRRLLRGQVHEAEPASGRVAPGQFAGRGTEGGQARTRPQPHVGGVPRAELAARTTAPEPGAEQHPRRAAQAGAGTIWSSKAATADTRKVSGAGRPGTAPARSGGHTFAVLGTPIRCSVLPGRSRCPAASCGSIMASAGSAAGGRWPARIRTRSVVIPSVPSGLATASSCPAGAPARPGTASS